MQNLKHDMQQILYASSPWNENHHSNISSCRCQQNRTEESPFKQAKIEIAIMNKSSQVCAQICPNTTRFSKHKQKLLVINNRSCNKCYCKKYLPTSPSIKLIIISFFFFLQVLISFLVDKNVNRVGCNRRCN